MTGLELICLALTVHFEARSEPTRGQIAVAQTVMARVESSRFLNSVCEVVHAGGEGLNNCHFSFYCDGLPETPDDEEKNQDGRNAWDESLFIANLVGNEGARIPQLEGVTHYHTTAVNPWWTEDMTHVSTIGNHEFWR